jgi:hypothetical protein
MFKKPHQLGQVVSHNLNIGGFNPFDNDSKNQGPAGHMKCGNTGDSRLFLLKQN